MTFAKFYVIIYLEKEKEKEKILCEILLLLGGNVVSWKNMFRIVVECNESNREMLKRMEHLYKITAEKQIATLEAIMELGDVELKKKIAEIYDAE